MALVYHLAGCQSLPRRTGAPAGSRPLETGEQRLERSDSELGFQAWFPPRLPPPSPSGLPRRAAPARRQPRIGRCLSNSFAGIHALLGVYPRPLQDVPTLPNEHHRGSPTIAIIGLQTAAQHSRPRRSRGAPSKLIERLAGI